MDHSTTLNLAQVFRFEGAERRRRSQPLEETVAELYATMRTPLLGYAYQVVGSTGEAEDLVQVAFLRLFDQLRSRAPIENLRSWLYRVVHNLAIDHLRHEGKQETAVSEWLAQRALDTPPSSAEEDLIRRQSIASSLAILNVRERYCLVLRAEGLSYKEIADVLSISAKAVSVYLSRGLKKFEVRHDRRA
jgi:RNA polymerase sigma-70 factor (ECF subfamily)